MGLVEIVLFYAAIVTMIYWHEIGHFGRRIQITQWIPFPVGRSDQARFRYGGLAFNLIAAYIIALWKPENLFLQMFGLANYLHFVIYCFWGSFNKEINWPKKYWAFVTFDDIPNKYWYIFVPAGMFVLWNLRWCYFPMITNILLKMFNGVI